MDGVDVQGHITTEVDVSHVAPPYEALVIGAVGALEEALGTGLVAVYVYGSVATGAATPPTSDLDLVAIVADGTDAGPVAEVAAALSARHAGAVREVAIGTDTRTALAAGTPEAHANRCFLRHYCALVWGEDVAAGFPACRPTPELAVAFAGDVAGHVERLLARLAAGPDPGFPAFAARRLLLAAAPLVSVLAGTWTTSRSEAVRLIARHHPAWEAQAQELARWLAGEPPRREVGALIESFGEWLAGPVVAAVGALSE